ncbi:succinylglutamate desuccinylase/aspartoacylase family protein [Nakamurella alba]|nr:M14 family metallopeptidase [Nakamurella alba]
MTTALPGHVVETVPVTRLGNGHSLELTVHRITGSAPGPTLVLFGGIHGDEAMGVEGVRRILGSLDPETMSGTVIGVPVCNPYSYDAMTRHTPNDGLNLNRIFPGLRAGSVTEQLAAVLSEIILQGDYFIDYHSSGLYSTVDYAYMLTDSRELSLAFGTKLLYAHDPFPGSSSEWAMRHGIPSFTSELGGGGQFTDEYLDKAVAGTRNVMRSIGILPGEVEELSTDRWVMDELVTLRPTAGGAMLSSYGPDQLGTVVPGGTELAKVVDPYTFETLETLVAPFESNFLVLAREGYTRCSPGDYGFMVGNAGTAKPVGG